MNMSRKKKDVFNQTTKRLGGKLTVRTSNDTRGALGYFDGESIVIKDDQSRVAKFVILIHEILHAVDRQLIVHGIRKRQVDHAWIINAAPNLLALFSALEVQFPPWHEVLKFMRQLEAPPSVEARDVKVETRKRKRT